MPNPQSVSGPLSPPRERVGVRGTPLESPSTDPAFLDRVRTAIRARLADEDGDTVVLAARAAGQLRDRDAIPRLRQLLDSDFSLYLVNAAHSLGLLADTASAPRLRALLTHPDENVRAAAATALGRLRDQDSLPLLKRLSTADPFPWVRAAAAHGAAE